MTKSMGLKDNDVFNSSWQLAGFAFAFGVAGGVALVGNATDAAAAQATASVGTTIQAAGSVGTVPPPVTPVATTTTTPVVTAKTSTNISTVSFSSSVNVGFDAPAPAAATPPGNAVAAQQRAARQARPFRLAGAQPVSVGPSAAVAVAGAPNQTYAVILPQQTVFASGSNLVSLSDFQHNAGQTPALDSRGSDVFSVGAASGAKRMAGAPDGSVPASVDDNVETEQNRGSQRAGRSGQLPLTGTDGVDSEERRAVLANAFAPRSPFVNIVVSYN